MADLDELFGPEAWGPIQDQLKRGEDPELSEIAQPLRGERPVPAEVRSYIADLLEKKKKRKRGPKVDKSDRSKVRYLCVRFGVAHWIEVCKRAKRRGIPVHGGPLDVAFEKVSKTTGTPGSTIKNIYYARSEGKQAV